MNTEIETLTRVVTQELEEIESNMVLEEVDKNDLNYTTDVNEWLETIKEIDIENKNTMGTGPNSDRVEDLYGHLNYHYNFDYDIIKNASGYITAPVFKYKNKVEAATYRIFNSIQELKSFLSVKKYLLYMIVVSVASKGLDTVEIDDLIIYPKQPMFKKPEVKYTFRGHILE